MGHGVHLVRVNPRRSDNTTAPCDSVETTLRSLRGHATRADRCIEGHLFFCSMDAETPDSGDAWVTGIAGIIIVFYMNPLLFTLW